MKKTYISPAASAQLIQYSGVLMSSGDRATSNINIHGGDNSGNVANAF